MAKFSSLAGTSNQAVVKATGKTWDEWIAIIDAFGGATKTHPQIARELYQKYQVTSWWSQQITVGFEYAKGKRVLGETSNSGFQVGSSKKLPITAPKLWDFMFSPKGLNIWLGEIDTFKLEPKAQYLTAEKTGGQVRTINPGKMLRLTYQRKGWQKHSTLQIRAIAEGDNTILSFHQEQLKDGKTRELMKQYWQEVLEKIEKELLKLIG